MIKKVLIVVGPALIFVLANVFLGCTITRRLGNNFSGTSQL